MNKVLRNDLGFKEALKENRPIKSKQWENRGGYARIQRAKLEDDNEVCADFALASKGH